jgi:hypothetical protein
LHGTKRRRRRARAGDSAQQDVGMELGDVLAGVNPDVGAVLWRQRRRRKRANP